ncbi:MAG: MarR family transcriptional regulator [Desulfovermiculus sp.]
MATEPETEIMDKEKKQAIQHIVTAIRQLVSSIHHNSSMLKKHYGLTGPQSEALRTLEDDGPMSSASLSRRLYVTPSNVTGIIDRLEKKGLVERIRKPKDRRVSLITLTEKGRTLYQSLPASIEGKLISGLDDMDLEQVTKLHEEIYKILDILDADKYEPKVLGDSVDMRVSAEEQARI